MLNWLLDLWLNNGKTLQDKINNVEKGNKNELHSMYTQDPVYFVPGYGYRLTADGRSVWIWRGGVDEIAYYTGTQKVACNITEEKSKAFNIKARLHAQRDGKKTYIGRVKTQQYPAIYHPEWHDYLFETETGKMIELDVECHKFDNEKWVYHCIKRYYEPFKDKVDYESCCDKEGRTLYTDRKLIDTKYITLKECIDISSSDINHFWKLGGSKWTNFIFALQKTGAYEYNDRTQKRTVYEDKIDKSKFINCYEDKIYNPNKIIYKYSENSYCREQYYIG